MDGYVTGGLTGQLANMKIDHIPKMRDAFVPPPVAHVIIGDGETAGGIKTIPFGRGLNSPILRIVEKVDSKTGIPETHLVVDEAYRQDGYKLLHDAYEEEGRMDDWEQWLGFCRAAVVPKKVPLNKYKEAIVPGFPDELLPDYCTELRKNAGPEGSKWEPKLPEKKQSKPKAKPSEASA